MQLSMILSKARVIAPPVLHFYHIANDMLASNRIHKKYFLARVSINAVKNEIKSEGEINRHYVKINRLVNNLILRNNT